MIRCLDILSMLLEWGYGFVFFWILKTFLALRRNWPMKLLALLACNFLAAVIIYSNDLAGLLGALLGFSAYIVVFHRGRWMEKLTAVLVFYPALIAVNYLMQDIGMRCFFGAVGHLSDDAAAWTWEQLFLSTAFHTASLLLRLLFWLLAWWILRKYLRQISSVLTVKMWLVVDVLILASFVAIFTVIYFMPENPLIVYPICGAAIFSSFGCIYLASYICVSMQTAYHVQELEQKQAYYRDRMKEEERVRSIYHDLKNHLLVLEARAGDGKELLKSTRELKSQIAEYENYHHTGNEFLDILIRDKAKAAKARNIDFSADVSFASGVFLEPLDISTIFGNALDNAIEASEKLPREQRLITLRGNRIRDMLVILVENNALPEAVADKGTSKGDAFVHGFGLVNIKRAVERYGGECRTRCEGGIFSLKVMIPVP